jgi:hypothetical protein
MTKMLKIVRRLLLIEGPRPFLQIVDVVVREKIHKYKIPLKLKETTCQRCDRVGHRPAYCIAKYDIAGYEIDEETSV